MTNDRIVMWVLLVLIVGISGWFLFTWIYSSSPANNDATTTATTTAVVVSTTTPTTTVVTTPPTTKLYENTTKGFSMVYPTDFIVDENYSYTNLGPTKTILGVKFTINPALATGTNLSNDTYISVEQLPKVTTCGASLFLDPGLVSVKQSTINEGSTTYSVLSTTGAGAGNRYEETVYAIPGSSPCIAVRYYIHYGSIENYPKGTVANFDKVALLSKFDEIRRTLFVK